MYIYTVAPVQSEAMQKVRRAGWDFASAGSIDRGDGYAVMRRRVRDCNAQKVVELLARARITAWQSPMR